MVTLDSNLATICESKPLLELARDIESRQISTLPGSALQYPFETIVLVEGDFDAKVLTHAASIAGVDGIRFFTPSQLDPTMTGDGIDSVRRFVQNHSRAFPQRLSGHPLLVLVDWEVSDAQVANLATRYGDKGATNCRKMDESWADDLVGKTFKGIERFYTLAFLNAAENDGDIELARRPNGELVVTKADLNAAKSRLATRFSQTTNPIDCIGLLPAIEWVDAIRNGGML